MPDDTENRVPNLRVLLLSVFIIASCGIFYELLIGTISTYFLGSSILHFSLTIGLFLFFMGIGSYFSKFFDSNLLRRFIEIELILAVVGGFSSFLLYYGFSITQSYYYVALILLGIIGILIGLEIPLVTRIINQYSTLKDTVANVFSVDYIGALFASIVFPLIFQPYLGIMRTSFLVGILNLLVAFANIIVFRKNIIRIKKLSIISAVFSVMLIAGFIYSLEIVDFFEESIYRDKIIFTKQSPYQRIVVTKWNQDYRLFINGNLQFSSVDEYRYHESLVHIPMLLTHNHDKVLILGGGDGLALRELTKYKDIKEIDLVDLDPEMTNLGKNNPVFRKLNNSSMDDPRLKVFNMDAYNYIAEKEKVYPLIIIDLPDANDTGLGKLYSKEFYTLLSKRLTADGIMVTQSTSPYFSRKSFWCIVHTADSVFKNVIPYTVYIPTFGQWGFTLVFNNKNGRISSQSRDSINFTKETISKLQQKLTNNTLGLRFLNSSYLPTLFIFDKEMSEVPTKINTLDNQVLVQYYEEGLYSWR